MQLLTRTEFDLGIRKGLPASVVVANKFGEAGNEGSRQLHEAAIIYGDKGPYLSW